MNGQTTSSATSSTDLSAHRTRSNVRPSAVRVETAGEHVEILADTAADELVKAPALIV